MRSYSVLNKVLVTWIIAIGSTGNLFCQHASNAGIDKSGPQADDTITKEQAAKILRELQAIRMLLENHDSQVAPALASPRKPERSVLSSDIRYIMGNVDSPLTLVEFTDLQCPFCSGFHKATLPELERRYIRTGQLRFVTMDYPLPSHAYALRAAAAARCADRQGKFWQMRERIITSDEVLTDDVLKRVASELSLNTEQLLSCLKEEQISADIQKDVQAATSIGINGTPAFILGRSKPKGAEGELIHGAIPTEALVAKIEALLRK